MSSRDVRYIPPSPEVLEHFAQDVCRELGPNYCDPDIVDGFASFMKVIARALANDLNREGDDSLDGGIE